MPRPPGPPTFDQLIDQLAAQAADFLKDQLGQFLPHFPSPGPAPRPKRVKGGQKGQKGGPGGSGRGQGGKSRTPRPAPLRTAYTVLGVDPRADIEVLQAAYRAMARKLHPDTNKDPRAVERMKELNAAWEILKDPVKRHTYDRGMGL